jgi:uncharacterized membrane protein
MSLSRSNFLDFWDRARSGYWLVPSVIVFIAAVAAFGLIWLDRHLMRLGTDSPLWLGDLQPDAAQAILSTIASSMITVAGVVFSITIVALQLASTQFGPRLLRTFMVDTGTQVVLGTFVATFLYCLVVLGALGGEDNFVPQYAATGGVVLGLLNIGVVIYFIHHIANAIRVENVIQALADEIREAIDTLFPEEIGHEPLPEQSPGRRDLPKDFVRDARPIPSRGEGYIRHVDETSLMEIAEEKNLLLRLDHDPGDFVMEGTVLISAWPRDRVDEDTATRLCESVVLGPQRTPLQDVGFAVQQLVEVGVRALSRAFNDPFTAVACVDRLGHALCRLALRRLPSPYRYDDRGRLRVVVRPITLVGLTARALDPIARSGGDNVQVVVHLINAVLLVARHARQAADRKWLLNLARTLREDGEARIGRDRDRRILAEEYEAAMARFQTDQRSLTLVPSTAAKDLPEPAEPDA